MTKNILNHNVRLLTRDSVWYLAGLVEDFYKNMREQIVDLEDLQTKCLTCFETEMDNRQKLESSSVLLGRTTSN